MVPELVEGNECHFAFFCAIPRAERGCRTKKWGSEFFFPSTSSGTVKLIHLM
jgi:hypothetical protein